MNALSMADRIRLVVGRHVFRAGLDFFLLDTLLPERWLDEE